MKKFHRVTVTAVMVLSVLFVADVADAATPSAQKVCVNKTTGVMRYVLKRGKQKCKKSEVRLIWNQAGVPGPAGANGATGATGPAGANGATGPAGANGTNASVAITQLSVCDGTDADTTANELCKIGMTGPGGGHVFFVDYNDQYAGFNYLEAAPVSCEGGIRSWSSANTAVTAARGWAADAVGQGQANTTAILAVFTADTSTNNAAKYADSLDCGSKTDWWLGSIGEMKLMYDNLRLAGVGGFASDYYWSSSELDAVSAWYQYFNHGSQDHNNKFNGTFYVRPVRAF